jgi:hypothetical protein
MSSTPQKRCALRRATPSHAWPSTDSSLSAFPTSPKQQYFYLHSASERLAHSSTPIYALQVGLHRFLSFIQLP